MNPFWIKSPRNSHKIPLLISCPHAGTEFPEALAEHYQGKFVSFPEDTDWYTPELYDFARDFGATIISSRYSRYIIDLNRDPESKNLYTDGRPPSLLVPLTSFAGEPLYLPGREPSKSEISHRKKLYYDPYHRAIQEILESFKKEFGTAVLFEAHSIKRQVTSIRQDPFRDLMLGTADGHSLSPGLKKTAIAALSSCPDFSLDIDDPFKGGYITRFFGLSGQGFEALQLELCQDLYLGKDGQFNSLVAAPLQRAINTLFTAIIRELSLL